MTVQQTLQTDVVVVGAGNAAMCAALAAREQGVNVLVLERAPKEERGVTAPLPPVPFALPTMAWKI